MPLRLTTNISRKIGLPNYSSLGASCGVELELDASLLASDPDGFCEQVCHAFSACRQAVDEELARHSTQALAGGNQHHSDSRAGHPVGNGDTQNECSNGQPATRRQLGYLRQLAGQIPGLGLRRLGELINWAFGTGAEDLTNRNASELIDALKRIKEGKLDLRAAFNGAAGWPRPVAERAPTENRLDTGGQ